MAQNNLPTLLKESDEAFRKEFGDNVVWWQECLAEMRIGDPDFKRLQRFINSQIEAAYKAGLTEVKEEVEKLIVHVPAPKGGLKNMGEDFVNAIRQGVNERLTAILDIINFKIK